MVMVTALALPAMAEDGVMLVMDGAALTVNMSRGGVATLATLGTPPVVT